MKSPNTVVNRTWFIVTAGVVVLLMVGWGHDGQARGHLSDGGGNSQYRLQRLEQKLLSAERKQLSSARLLQRQEQVLHRLTERLQRLERSVLSLQRRQRAPIERVPRPEYSSGESREDIDAIWLQLEAILRVLKAPTSSRPH